MNNIFDPVRSSKTSQAFLADYQSNVNYFTSVYLKRSQDVSRRLATETAVGRMVIDRFTQYVIGKGLFPIAAPERSRVKLTDSQYEKFTKSAESFWRLMTDTKEFDYYRRNNFAQIQRIAFQNILISGDVLRQRYFDNKANGYRPRIKIISGSCVKNPQNEILDKKDLIAGVKFNDKEGEIGYYIATTDDYLMDNFQCKYVPKYLSNGFEAYDLIQLDAIEANQVRGVPFLAPVRDSIIDLQVFFKAHTTKAIVDALLTVFITTPEDSTSDPSKFTEGLKDLAAQSAEIAGRAEDKTAGVALGNGNVLQLGPGETPVSIESKAVSSEFDSFLKAMLSIIGGGRGIPMEMLLQSYNASYSASRATIASAEKTFETYRTAFSMLFCQPEWEQVIDYGIRMGLVEAPGYMEADELTKKAYLASAWVGPSPVSIDPVKEVNAYAMAVKSCFCSHEDATRALFGHDFEEVADRQGTEKRMMENLGLIQEADTEPVKDDEEKDEEEGEEEKDE